MPQPTSLLDQNLKDSLRRGGVLILRRTMSVSEAEAITEQALERLQDQLRNGDLRDKQAIVHAFWLLLDGMRGAQPQYPMATPEELAAAGKAIRTVLSQLSDHQRLVLTMYVGLSGKAEDEFARPGSADSEARELLARIRRRYLKLISERQGKGLSDERAAG